MPSPLLAAVRQLRDRTDLVVRPSDKNCGTTVMERSLYLRTLARVVSDRKTYTRLDTPVDQHLEWWRKQATRLLVTRLRYSPVAASRLLEDTTVPSMYLLPKLHKPRTDMSVFPCRPIVAVVHSPTTSLSDTLVHLLQPLLQHDNWTLHSTDDFVRLLERNTTVVTADTYLITFDVEALYPSMQLDDTIAVVVGRFCTAHRLPPESAAVRTLFDMLQCVLRLSFFTCMDQHGVDRLYQQRSGMSMGVSVAPVLGNLYVGSKYLAVFARFRQYFGVDSVLLARGYIDDGVAVVTTSPAGVNALLDMLHTAHPSLRLEIKTSQHSLVFLDVEVYKGPRWRSTATLLDTRVYQKPQNRYLYIPFESNHPLSARVGFIYGEGVRFVKLSSDLNAVRDTCRLFVQRLQARGYPLQVIVDQLVKVDYRKRRQYLRLDEDAHQPRAAVGIYNRAEPAVRDVPLVVPYCDVAVKLGIQSLVHNAVTRIPYVRPVVAWVNTDSLAKEVQLKWPSKQH